MSQKTDQTAGDQAELVIFSCLFDYFTPKFDTIKGLLRLEAESTPLAVPGFLRDANLVVLQPWRMWSGFWAHPIRRRCGAARRTV